MSKIQGTVAEQLRVVRARRGLSLVEAAERTGVDRHTIAALERGKRAPYFPTLERLADGYGVQVEELLEVGGAQAEESGPIAAGKAEAPEESGPPLVKDSAAHMGFKLNIEAHAVREVIRNACLKALAGGDLAVIEDEAVQELSKAA
jgi:transcriptional regulator with XRE-family HTH domain